MIHVAANWNTLIFNSRRFKICCIDDTDFASDEHMLLASVKFSSFETEFIEVVDVRNITVCNDNFWVLRLSLTALRRMLKRIHWISFLQVAWIWTVFRSSNWSDYLSLRNLMHDCNALLSLTDLISVKKDSFIVSQTIICLYICSTCFALIWRALHIWVTLLNLSWFLSSWSSTCLSVMFLLNVWYSLFVFIIVAHLSWFWAKSWADRFNEQD